MSNHGRFLQSLLRTLHPISYFGIKMSWYSTGANDLIYFSALRCHLCLVRRACPVRDEPLNANSATKNIRKRNIFLAKKTFRRIQRVICPYGICTGGIYHWTDRKIWKMVEALCTISGTSCEPDALATISEHGEQLWTKYRLTTVPKNCNFLVT